MNILSTYINQGQKQDKTFQHKFPDFETVNETIIVCSCTDSMEWRWMNNFDSCFPWCLRYRYFPFDFIRRGFVLFSNSTFNVVVIYNRLRGNGILVMRGGLSPVRRNLIFSTMFLFILKVLFWGTFLIFIGTRRMNQPKLVKHRIVITSMVSFAYVSGTDYNCIFPDKRDKTKCNRHREYALQSF